MTEINGIHNQENKQRHFLFLQGPHGPFFGTLAHMLSKTGAKCWRVGFNRGDQFFWPDKKRFIKFSHPMSQWNETFKNYLSELDISDIVLYGDTRQHHAQAITIAKELGLGIHVFEEGYLRPYWVTYERNGSNGNSRLMDLNVNEMQAALEHSDLDTPLPPSHWGDTRQHVFYGALYHWFVMFWNHAYPNFTPHRKLKVHQEFLLYVKRLTLMPFHSLNRRFATARIKNGGFPYHVVLLQLEHDASFQSHSPFSTMSEFLEICIKNFAKGAPKHHHLVFKAHPLEDGRAQIRLNIRKLIKKYDLNKRVHYVRGGKLAHLLNDARSAVTVNSTAGQQVLWRGIPLRTFGRSVYEKHEFINQSPLDLFFAQPYRPDNRAYKEYRRFLLETSQIPGGYYSSKGRRQLLRLVVDMMLANDDPYDALFKGTAAPRQHLRVVK